MTSRPTEGQRRAIGPLEVGWLEDLVAIAEKRTFTKAAELRNVTQPALTRRIQSLEEWAGASLIDRSRTPLVLTPAGETLLQTAVELLRRLAETRHAIREAEARAPAEVRLAAPHVMSVSFFPRWIPAVQKRFAGTLVSISSDRFASCFDSLADGTVDFVVCMIDPTTQPFGSPERAAFAARCAAVTLGRDQLMPLSAPDEAGAPLHSLYAPDGSVSYLSYGRNCVLGCAVRDLITRQPDVPRLDMSCDSSLSDGLRRMAISGLGVAWLPRDLTRADLAEGSLVRAGPDRLDIDMEIRAYRAPRPLPAAAETFWAWLGEGLPAPSRRARHDHALGALPAA